MLDAAVLFEIEDRAPDVVAELEVEGRHPGGEPLGDIARSYNVSPSTISRLTA